MGKIPRVCPVYLTRECGKDYLSCAVHQIRHGIFFERVYRTKSRVAIRRERTCSVITSFWIFRRNFVHCILLSLFIEILFVLPNYLGQFDSITHKGSRVIFNRRRRSLYRTMNKILKITKLTHCVVESINKTPIFDMKKEKVLLQDKISKRI